MRLIADVDDLQTAARQRPATRRRIARASATEGSPARGGRRQPQQRPHRTPGDREMIDALTDATRLIVDARLRPVHRLDVSANRLRQSRRGRVPAPGTAAVAAGRIRPVDRQPLRGAGFDAATHQPIALLSDLPWIAVRAIARAMSTSPRRAKSRIDWQPRMCATRTSMVHRGLDWLVGSAWAATADAAGLALHLRRDLRARSAVSHAWRVLLRQGLPRQSEG